MLNSRYSGNYTHPNPPPGPPPEPTFLTEEGRHHYFVELPALEAERREWRRTHPYGPPMLPGVLPPAPPATNLEKRYALTRHFIVPEETLDRLYPLDLPDLDLPMSGSDQIY